jgi:Co/Zn/Cd efflux system component
MRHDDGHVHRHTHGTVDPGIVASERGIWAVKLSFFALCITALIQVYVVWISGSVALLADTIHNFGDAATALPLGLAFRLARRFRAPNTSRAAGLSNRGCGRRDYRLYRQRGGCGFPPPGRRADP